MPRGKQATTGEYQRNTLGNKYASQDDGLLYQLSKALVQRYDNQTDKRARYRPKNPDKKPLGNPTVRKMNAEEREKLRKYKPKVAA
jgi:hypothetical protein